MPRCRPVRPAATTEPPGAERGPAGDRDGVVAPAGSAIHLGPGIPPIAAVRIGDQRAVGDGGGPCQKRCDVTRSGAIDADGDHARRVPERDGLLDRLAGGRAFPVAACVAQPGGGSHVLEQGDEDLRFANGRDRFEREQVDARREQRFHAWPVERGQGGAPGVIVAAVLRAVGEHRAIRPDRPGHEQPVDRRATGLVR